MVLVVRKAPLDDGICVHVKTVESGRARLERTLQIVEDQHFDGQRPDMGDEQFEPALRLLAEYEVARHTQVINMLKWAFGRLALGPLSNRVCLGPWALDVGRWALGVGPPL